MKKTITVVVVISALVFAGCSSSDKKLDGKTKDKYEITKESLEETEKKNPARFISVEGHDKKNLVGQTVIRGAITSNAKVATYKDINVELTFYSKTGALLEKDSETIFETLSPGQRKTFKTKYFAPKGTDSVAMRVLSAKN